MNLELFNLSEEQQNMLLGKKTVTTNDVKDVLKTFSSGKIKNAKVGRLHVEEFISPEIDFTLFKHDRHIVFYALEKVKESLFSKAKYRVFIWPIGFDEVIAVSPGSVSFEAPIKGYSKEIIFLKRHGNEHEVCKLYCYNREHLCIFEKSDLYRKFAIDKKKVTCIKDYAIHHYHWTNPDGWVPEHFHIETSYEPLFFLRNDPEEIPSGSVKLSYPSRPALYGHDFG